MDKIYINNLELNTIVGVHPHERDQAQPIIIDLTLEYDLAQAIVSDKLADTLDYALVCESIEQLCETKHFELIEALAGAIVDMLLAKFKLHAITINLAKPQALANAVISVQLYRENN
jgi:dihydroneopterin aldolase